MQMAAVYAVAVAAIASYAILTILSKKLQVSVPPFTFIALAMFVLSASALIAALFFEKTTWVNIKGVHLGLLVLFGLVNLLAFWLFLYAIGHMSAANYQLMVAALGPLFVALFASFFLGEELKVRLFIAVPIILLGLYIALGK